MYSKLIRSAVFGVLLVFILAGCSTASSPGAQSGDHAILAACTPNKQIAADDEIDGSGSSSDEAISTERLSITADVVRRTAICGGHLLVRAFSTSSGATVTIYDGDLTLPGATDNARLRRVDPLVEKVMADITAKYGAAIAALPNGGSDITSVYRLAGEYAAQLGDGYTLHLYLLTDGLNNIGTDLQSQVLTPAQATDLAGTVSVPALPGAIITVAGLGRVDGDPAPSPLVEGLVAFYNALCLKTTAKTCVSVTDYTAVR
ncbi:hypothetical protein [Glaciihabitans sp. UYNi722]|uniref:hypothetical protein n=1 Tax=Glaciihabitans sp. UYNi722 TaxID=3156344 RepID=UPI003392FEF6